MKKKKNQSNVCFTNSTLKNIKAEAIWVNFSDRYWTLFLKPVAYFDPVKKCKLLLFSEEFQHASSLLDIYKFHCEKYKYNTFEGIPSEVCTPFILKDETESEVETEHVVGWGFYSSCVTKRLKYIIKIKKLDIVIPSNQNQHITLSNFDLIVTCKV